MKLITLLLCTAFWGIGFSQYAFAHAISKKITLYANGAVVQESMECNAEQGKITLYLPGSLSMDSLSIDASTLEISETLVRKVDGNKLIGSQLLKTELEKLENKLQEVTSKKQLLDARMNFWKKTGVEVEEVSKAVDFENYLAERLGKLNSDRIPLLNKMKKLKKEISVIKKRMKEQGETQECYEVSALVTDSNRKYVNGKVNLALSYMLKDCGWDSQLTLDARPKENSVHYENVAMIQQHTGIDWDDVELTLSSVPINRQITPPKLNHWIIQTNEEYSNNFHPDTMVTGAAMMDAEGAPRVEKKAAKKVSIPTFSEQSVSGTWAMGRRSIPAGIPVRITLDQKIWQADFTRLIRPSLRKEAYLNANITLPAAISISRDKTSFLVDGIPVGSKHFSFIGDKGNISFGNDPSVTAEMKAVRQQKSKTGFVGKKQTYEWNWNIEIKNAHHVPIKVLVEDPAPRSRDKDITLKITSKPTAIAKDDTLSWELEVPASSTSTIQHTVSLEAPASMKIIRGR